jgi:hypothetical protein
MQSQDTIGEILSRFPGPLVLRPSRAKWFGILLGCAGFVVVSCWMIVSGSAYGWRGPVNTAFGWGGLVFFSIGLVIAVVAMLPDASALKLDQEGFEITNLFRRQSFRWQDATGFAVAKISASARVEMVVFDDANAKEGKITRFNIANLGHNSGLADTYGFPPEALASLMAQWRERAVQSR